MWGKSSHSTHQPPGTALSSGYALTHFLLTGSEAGSSAHSHFTNEAAEAQRC